MKRIILALLALTPTPAVAQTQIFWGENDGQSIYHEDKSCALYIDFANGTRLRLSDRTDERRVYINITNPNWPLADQVGQGGSLSVEMVGAKQTFFTSTTVVRIGNSYGFSGGDFPNDLFLDALAQSSAVVVSNIDESGLVPKATRLSRFSPTGIARSVASLRACQHEFFG